MKTNETVGKNCLKKGNEGPKLLVGLALNLMVARRAVAIITGGIQRLIGPLGGSGGPGQAIGDRNIKETSHRRETLFDSH